MALFVVFEIAGTPSNKIWVNAQLITSVRPGAGCTTIHFERDHFIAVNESIERVMLQITTEPIST
jgi:hypothetical protein